MQPSRFIVFKTRFGRIIAAILAAILILLISPVLLIIAVLVKCTSRGPVLYVADRLGRDGRVFRMVKFRSMKVNAPETVAADGKVIVAKRDPRFTCIAPILRLGFDELPQLFNVLKGEMVFIGPRPDVTRMIDVYTPEQTPRLLAVPGLTGLTQVLDGRHLTNEHNYELDVYYVNHGSLAMDLMVLVYTIPFILGRRAIGIPYLRRIMPEAAAYWDEHHDDEES